MAKQRSGLGRGLGSLLGAEPEGSLSQEMAMPIAKHPEPPVPKVPELPKQVVAKDEETVEETPVQVEEESIYTSNEDHITIKGVVEREVKPQERTVIHQADKATDEVDIDLIEPNPNQPRTNFKKEELEELAESIKKNGLLQPILVRKEGDKYNIIAGERRWQACKNLGMKRVPVRIKEADDDEAIILALVENIQRSNLNPIEEAYGYRRMMERGKMTQSEVAQAVSKGRTTITNALRLLELPEDAQQLLFEEKITAGHARAILSINTKEGRRKLTDRLIEEKLSVRDAERIAKLINGKEQKEPAKAKPQAPKSYKTVARALKDSLDTEVKIRTTNGKNKIEIAFKDEADLQRLYRVIAGIN